MHIFTYLFVYCIYTEYVSDSYILSLGELARSCTQKLIKWNPIRSGYRIQKLYFVVYLFWSIFCFKTTLWTISNRNTSSCISKLFLSLDSNSAFALYCPLCKCWRNSGKACAETRNEMKLYLSYRMRVEFAACIAYIVHAGRTIQGHTSYSVRSHPLAVFGHPE